MRYCVPDKSKNALRAVSVTDLRGDGAIREVSLTIGGQELHIAIVNGLIHAKELIADIEAGKRFYHLVEVMTCQGGCVGGAGQPYGLSPLRVTSSEQLATKGLKKFSCERTNFADSSIGRVPFIHC